MKSLSLITLLILPVCLFAQPTKEQIQEVNDARKIVQKMKGELFPAFEFETLDGKTITSKDTKGKILLINFWFTRCRPCIMEMPEMNEMVAEFSDEEIVFLALTFDNSELVNRFLEKRNFNYQIIADRKDFCLELNVRSYPTHFIVNSKGVIEKVIIGYSAMTVGALKKSVRKLLKSK